MIFIDFLHVFLNLCFLIFRQWLKELAISDVRIGFYVSNCVFSQLEMSIGRKFGQKIIKIRFGIFF